MGATSSTGRGSIAGILPVNISPDHNAALDGFGALQVYLLQELEGLEGEAPSSRIARATRKWLHQPQT